MSWTINNTPISDLGITVTTIDLQALSASRCTLEVEVESYTEAGAFTVGQTLVLRKGANSVFVGRVRRVPRAASGANEALTYEVTDAWDDLDRLPYQTVVNRVKEYDPDGNPIFADYNIGKVVFGDTVDLGGRVSAVLSFAAGACGLGLGNIAAPVPWLRVEHKDQTCGEVLRDTMRLLPDYHLYIDHSSGTQVMHLVARSSLPAKTYNVASGTAENGQIIDGHNVTAEEFEKASVVAVRFEKPVTVNSTTQTQMFEDVYPIDASTNQLGAVIETAQLEGANQQHEYAPITVTPIPQADASEEDQKEWWISHTPELAQLADQGTLAWLKNALVVPTRDAGEEVLKHRVKVVVDGVERPTPINPESTPVEQTTDVADYPNEIIEGQLPEWAGKRYRKVAAAITLGITQQTFELITDEDLKKAVGDIFSIVREYTKLGVETTYRIATFNGEVMGTNATTRNYSRVVSWDAGEMAPTGLAQAVYNQLSITRHSGSLSLVGQDPDISISTAHKVNFTGGDPAWATMQEGVQSVSYDVQNGTTNCSFGVSQVLGANDLIERLRANRRNTLYMRTRPEDGESIRDGVGGYVASPFSNFSRVSGGGEANYPFAVIENGGGYKINEGALFISSAFYAIDTETNSAARADGDHAETEELDMTGEHDVGVLQAGRYGAWLCTDHLGAPQWAVLGWDSDRAPASHNPIQNAASIGLYFFPVAEFEEDGSGGHKLKKQLRKSDIYWHATAIDAFGTTVAWAPPVTPPEPT